MNEPNEAELQSRLRGLAADDEQRVASPKIRDRVMHAWDEHHDTSRRIPAARLRSRVRIGLLLATAAGTMFFAVLNPWRGSEWLATVEAADGSHYALKANVVLRPGTGTAMLTLKDGSRVEVRSDSELSLERAADGIGIQLRTGSLIVDSSTQPHEHLYVRTRDLTVAVARTKFVVNADEAGSRVMVVEGDVQVREGATERRVRPGEQLATSAVVAARSIAEDVFWSRQRNVILTAFTKGMTETAAPVSPASAQSSTVAAGAEPSAIPDFEAASIRECDPDHLPASPEGARGGGANSLQLTPGRLRALCMTMATLVRTAYQYGPIGLDFIESGRGRAMQFTSIYGLGVEDGRRVRGGPDWVRSARYTVEAVAPANAKVEAETLRSVMLQRLLERRAALKVHIETEQIPAFALTVAKGGLKLKPVDAGACEARVPYVPGTPIENMPRPRSFAEVRRGEKPTCGLSIERNGPNMVVVGGNVTLNALVFTLGGRLGGVRVLDRTGVTDKFNFVLEFVLDDNTPGTGGP